MSETVAVPAQYPVYYNYPVINIGFFVEAKPVIYDSYYYTENRVLYCATTNQNGGFQYVYCFNNPVMLTDPDGRNPLLDADGNSIGTTNGSWKGVPMVKTDKGNIPLNKYSEGISISNKTWEHIESQEGADKRLTPYIENKSESSVYYKPEGTVEDRWNKQTVYCNIGNEYKDNRDAYELEAGKDLYARFDGVATSKYNDRVFKVSDNTKITIGKDGDITVKNFSPSMSFSKYGWVKHSSFKIAYDKESWAPLFNKASEIGKSNYIMPRP